MAGKEWTQEEIKILKEKYPTAPLGIKDMVNWLPGRSQASIHSKASLLGLKSSYAGRQFFYNERFWEGFNKLNCYWAGFSAADASISLRPNQTVFRIEVTDKCQLDNFIKDTDASYLPKKSKYRGVGKQLFNINFCIGEKWLNALENNFNITPRKTYTLKPPVKIPNDLFVYYLIGFIDGDGCWHKHKNNKSFSLSFSSASKDILEYINLWIEANYSPLVKKSRSVKAHNDRLFSLHIGGAVACQMYLDLRQLIPERHLSRKWDNPKKIKFCRDYLALHKNLLFV